MRKLNIEDKITFFQRSKLFRDVSRKTLVALAEITTEVHFKKDQIIVRNGDLFTDPLFVYEGLLRISACSSSGRRITYLLVNKGEPYNILSPFSETTRFYDAEAVTDTCCLQISGPVYISFLEKHPDVIRPLFSLVTRTLDSSISRILDLMEKKVEERIMRVLKTLDAKFGSPLMFTSVEVSELAGTTPESTLRAMGNLRAMGAIETQRGKIWIKDSEIFNKFEEEDNMAL